MTKEEFDSVIAEQKEKGMSEEDIAKAFAVMFKEDLIDRKALEGLLGGIGYSLEGELADLSDEELKEKILVEGEAPSKEEAKEGEGGEPAPSADEKPAEEKEEPKEPKEEKPEEKEEKDEKEEAMKRFGLR